jgi:hemerythrin-like domain-containing protein
VKRSSALTQLSRDHHRALAMALQLRRAGSPAADRQAFLEFFESEGQAHFAIEEDILLPAIGDVLPRTDPDVHRMLQEHQQIRDRARSLADDHDPAATALQELGALLEGHVRHEERTVFPRIESLLDNDRLQDLEKQLQQAEAS